MEKKKIYKILFIILSIISIILFIFILKKIISSKDAEIKNKETIEVFSKIESDEKEKQAIKLNGYDVIGTVNIPKINIEYPIISIDDPSPEKTKILLEFAIVRYWGNNVNEYGNLSIAGHNKYNGTMFGKLKKIEIGDEIYLTDLNKITIDYIVYSKFTTDPNDVSVLETKDENIREVTLITCSDGNRKRLIIKAKEREDL